eukprot:TRINITY_DN4522_c0_g1_i2.p1 TRINITY_DN4522_c0_g1~~TRINITY_DN4522_c0_g1_i2.p1  ORF type:complete len:348 (-),score=49.31 TRINITY_DN4522_c0_g1_i2:472-1515(-)
MAAAKPSEEATSGHATKVVEATESKARPLNGAHGPVQSRPGAERPPASHEDPWEVTILTYNVWFREEIKLEARMRAIGAIILETNPHVICFQEVTPNIYRLFQASKWWPLYNSSSSAREISDLPYFSMQLSRLHVKQWQKQPFFNSRMGRELIIGGLSVPPPSQPSTSTNLTATHAGLPRGTSLLVATSHLESPCPAPPSWNQFFTAERKQQAEEAMTSLNDGKNVVFCGDMNWNDTRDGTMEAVMPEGWKDAWLQLHPKEPGLTYDSKANAMLAGGRLKGRLDRMLFKCRDFEPVSIRMVGTDPIPGLTYDEEKTVKGQKKTVTRRVVPSDHFGLLFKMRLKTKST